MAFLFRWLTRAFLALALLACAAAALVYYLATQSLPDYDRTYRLDGPRAEIRIPRDSHAVPHILATNDADAFFGLGFVHAQDRLWQMTLLRRTAQGRLSELFGAETLPIDRLMRALDLYGLARQAADRQDPATRAALEAYSVGVNAWLRVVRDEALGRGAPEFFLFDARLAPWTPADSVAILKLMALRLTDKAERETLRASLSLSLPPERLRDILPESPNAAVMALPKYSELLPGAPGNWSLASAGPLDPAPPLDLAGASNAFAATGARAARGAPLIASDPHLALSAPSIWMLARMNLEAGPVIGGTIPGIPAVLIGRNPDLAWGLTSSYLDDQDVYVEKLDPADPGRYLTPEGYRPFVARKVKIAVKGAEPVEEELRWTRHGPVVPPDRFGVAAVTPPGHVASLAWTALTPEDGSIAAAIELMRAHSIREAREAARDVIAPSMNLTLADRSSVGLQMTGAAPARRPESTSQGRIPSPGWLAVNDWQGRRPFEENPWVVDPPSGIVVNTNNRITEAAFPDHLSFDWGDDYRIRRAAKLLGEREYHSLDSFIEIQTDTVSQAARDLLPLIARDLWYSGEPTAADPVARQRQLALERLANWTGEMNENDPEPLIYAAWIRALKRRLAVDELGPMVDEVPLDAMFIERVYRDAEGASAWCDVRQTTAKEDCVEMARRALDDALAELQESYGPRLESWRWGDAHVAIHRHTPLGDIPGLRQLVNIRQGTAGGDDTLMRGLTPGGGPYPYRNVHAAGLRVVQDFADPDSSVFIVATGESGHPLSRHYDDLADPWRRGEYIPMALDLDRVRAGSAGTTTLLPAAP
ncbi:penicillin acylase family protein [Amaricoccus solimangrovi]|uniref:Penicillin acylase family protein n=1 Tax=Amaricoccus solimangrovi TaxID=2589815 RepID=A0A501WZF4_9RHOB|nr:penicillin acylase family protein [Amaricoccus solimangrovi]TPE53824.1 penicillin acylase family protein [Amaricoccus solimangrovi]